MGAGVGDIIFFRVPESLEGCDGWDEGWGILYLTLVKWKDIRPWQPEFGPEGKHFISGNSLFLIFGGRIKQRKLRWSGGAQRPVWSG